MDDEKSTEKTTDAWKEVGDQFQVLGDSIAAAFTSAWENEHNQQVIQDMQAGLESMVNSVGKAIDDAVKSPEGQQIREEAEKVAESAREAGEKTVEEVRPHLLSALQTVNDELQKLLDKLNKPSPAEDASAGGED